MIEFRPAAARDARAIRSLIFRVGINPLGLDWRRFLVAVDDQDVVIGCGQIKPHNDGTQELASVAVQPEYQGQRIGHEIIHRLLASHPLPLYLTCRESLGSFYERFGFYRVESSALPSYFRRIKFLFNLLRRISPDLEDLLVMANHRA